MAAKESLFLTGATGLIGGELLRLLLQAGTTHAWTLVRARSGVGTDYRLTERLARSGNHVFLTKDRVTAVAGDLTREGLGLTGRERSAIADSIQTIIHCAAETSFIRDEECSRINIGGMANLIEFARGCARDPLIVHISTARNGNSETLGPARQRLRRWQRTVAFMLRGRPVATIPA